MSRLPTLSILVLFALLLVPSSIKGANLFRFDPSRGSPLFTSELADDDSGDSSEGQPNGDGFFLHLFQASSSSSRTGNPAAAVSASKDLPFQSFDFNLDEQEEAREAVQRARLAKIAEMGAIPARVAPADGDEFDQQQNLNQEPSTLTLFTTLNIALVFLATSIGFFIFALYRYPPVALMERVKGHLATRFQPI